MPNWKKVVVSGSDATLNSLYVAGPITGSDIKIDDWGSISASLASINSGASSLTLQDVTDNGNTTTNDIYISSSKSLYLGANSYIRREQNGGGNENIQLNGSVRLNPNTSANANNGVVIGGNGYLLAPNSSRNAQLNYGSVSGQFGIYKLNVYGADSIFQNGISVGTTVDPVFLNAGDEGIHIRPSTGQAVLRFTVGSATGSSAGADVYYSTTGEDTLYLLNRASGSIALGTNNQKGLTLTPSGDLYVTGSTNVFGGGSNPSTQIVIQNSSTSPGLIRFNDGTTAINSSPGFIKYDHADDSLSLGTNTYSGLVLDTNRKLKLNAYGSGTVTGTSAYNLAVDSLGNVIETTTPTPTLQQVTNAGNISSTPIIITGSSSEYLQVNTSGFAVSSSIAGPYHGKSHEVIYDVINADVNSTTTIAQLPSPGVVGFTLDYVAWSGNVYTQAARAGVVKGVLRASLGGSITKGYHITETTTLDLIDQGAGTTSLTFDIVQDTNGTSNQLVAVVANNDWYYQIGYTLTIYYNPQTTG